MKFGEVCMILATFGSLAAADPASQEAESIVLKSLERNASNQARLKDYTYTETQETRTFDKQGAVVKTEREAFDVVNLYGRPYKRRTSKDGHALEGKEKEKADEAFEKEVRKREKESDGERRKREEDQEKARVEEHKFLEEIPRAYSFEIAGEETLDGKPAWVIEATPRTDFHSRIKHGDLLKKIQGRLWIDKESLQWVRAELEVIEPISFGGFLAKLDKGAKMTFRQQRINDEVWLPSKMTARVDARLLVKRYRVANETIFSNYRKFRVDSRVLPQDDAAAPER